MAVGSCILGFEVKITLVLLFACGELHPGGEAGTLAMIFIYRTTQRFTQR
jgi:hypothetical protein